MDLYPSDEQRELAAAVRDVLAGAVPPDGATVNGDAWSAAADQGWFALGLDEADGGLGGTLADEAQVFAQIGAAAAAGPFLATNLAARVATTVGDRALAEGLVSGVLRAAHAFGPHDGTDRVTAFDARGAAVLLLVDEQRSRLRLCRLADRDIVDDLSPMDPAVTVARISLDRAEVLAEITGARAGAVLVRASVLVAAMLSGVATAATSMSVEYAKIREQFGRPIGAFQAISHRCAEMAIRSNAASAVVDLAAVSVDEEHPDARRRVAAARRFTESSALENARVNIQNHGAIGFTWEHGAHRLLKRARFLGLGIQPREAQTEVLVGAG
ncbi:acyl-CoA dehydrogenase family protein [Polymorphospora sp. NPDC050346]|uniref:acyl-CoA dehydrogenase family protein n=1 Tax=Polymorphospora sp. NPDC050346 TaxID=3155780 RepID=UPI0033EF02A9